MAQRLTAKQRAYLDSLSPRTVACKGSSQHPFPRLIPGEPVPPGVTVMAATGGCEVTFECPVCGRMKREFAPRGVLGASEEKPSYFGGEESYIAKGMELTRADHRDYYQRSLAATLMKAARKRRAA